MCPPVNYALSKTAHFNFFVIPYAIESFRKIVLPVSTASHEKRSYEFVDIGPFDVSYFVLIRY